MFMQENLRVREQRAQGTTDFLGSQLEDAKRDLDEQDAKLATFKRKYLGQLPGEDQGNFNMLASLNSQLDASTQAINQLQQNRTYTEAMLSAQLQSWQNLQASSGNSATPETLDQQLAKDQAQLSELQSKYTETYPDVVRLKNDIEQLKKKIQEQRNLAESLGKGNKEPDRSRRKCNSCGHNWPEYSRESVTRRKSRRGFSNRFRCTRREFS